MPNVSLAKTGKAKTIRDQAEARRHYAKQRNDPELDRWMSEIRLQAIAQIGKISRELEKAKAHKGHGGGLPVGGKTKERQLL